MKVGTILTSQMLIDEPTHRSQESEEVGTTKSVKVKINEYISN